MKPFEEWLQQSQTLPKELSELPDGVDEIEPGCYRVKCLSCERWFPMEWDLAEDTHESHYCNGSDRCMP